MGSRVELQIQEIFVSFDFQYFSRSCHSNQTG